MRKREIEDVSMSIAFAEYKFWFPITNISFKGELYIERIFAQIKNNKINEVIRRVKLNTQT